MKLLAFRARAPSAPGLCSPHTLCGRSAPSLGILLLAAFLVSSTFAGVDFRQAANNDPAFGLGNLHWINSILQRNNSVYFEGMSVLQRVLLTSIPPTVGNHHSLLFRHQFTKGQVHAYDFLISYAQAQADDGAALGATIVLNPCGAEIGPPASMAATCAALHNGANSMDVPVPDDAFISKDGPTSAKIAAYEAVHGNRTIRISGDAPISNASLTLCHDVPDLGDNSDSFVLYALTWDSSSANILIEMAGHLAVSGDGGGESWGANLGSASINGGSYHFKLDSLAGALTDNNCPPGQNQKEIVSLGAQDNQVRGPNIFLPAPPCNITGASPVCDQSTNVYQAISVGPNLTFSWTNSGNAIILGPATSSNVTVKATGAGAYTLSVTITATSGGYSTNSTCTLTVPVNPLPPCGITGPTSVCPLSTNSYTGPSGMAAYAWSINGNGFIAGSAALQNLEVGARGVCGSNFTVTLTVTDTNGCSNTCRQTNTVEDSIPPQITCPPTFTAAERPRYSGGAIVHYPPPVATDNCAPTPTVSGSPPAGSIFPIGSNTVTGIAVDDCGNSSSCTFVVRVIPYELQVTNAGNSGPGTLRQAILDANDSPDENLIVFNLPGAGPHTIRLLAALPQITSPVIIDGWSQSGANTTPGIELEGNGASNAFDGLVIVAGSSTVRGLALNGFATAVRIETNGGNVIQGNFIGTDLTGTNALGNSRDGIYINSAQNLIGETTNGAANLIAFNGRNGIAVAGSAGNRNGFIANRIFANAGLGIDLGDDGVTPNDANDSDDGPNGYQNFPVLSDAQSIDGITTVSGALNSLPGTIFRLDFFLNDSADPSGYGEGQIYLGSTSVTVHENSPELFSIAFPVTATFTQFVTAIATDPLNNSSEFSRAIQVRTLPILGLQPVSTNVAAGTTATFCTTATGTRPIYYQWRLNGVNIAGATNPCYTIPSAQVAQGGTYTVVLANDLGALATIPASLTLRLPAVSGADNFADRVTLAGTNGIIAAENRNATFEPGEPRHAGKPGGKSVWYTWTPPLTGVATFRTLGSTFDTLLAVYNGSALTNLATVDSDEDRGGFYTSKTFFNAFKDVPYQIAIDGFGGAQGQFVLAWEEEDTPHLIPIFTNQPASQTVALGSNATFRAVAVSVCGNGHVDCVDPGHYPGDDLPKLDYQWYFNGAPIAGATTNTLTVTNVQPSSVGTYTLRVATTWHTIESKDASLQINLTGSGVEEVQAFDKLLDSDQGTILHIGVPPGPINAARDDTEIGPLSSSIVRGYTGTQIFNTVGTATGPGETICGVIGGASAWITFVADASGTLFLNTDGSSYDTVMAVFQRSATNAAALELLACDNNSGTNAKTSLLSLPVQAGKTNYIVVDGVNGTTGILQLNYSLVTGTIIKSLGVTAQGAQRLQVNGRTNLHFTIQASTNLVSWISLVTTTSATGVFEYVDNGSINFPRRFYRAVLLP